VQLQPISVVLTAPEEEVVAINQALAKGDVEVIAQSSDGLKTLAKGTLQSGEHEVDQAAGHDPDEGAFRQHGQCAGGPACRSRPCCWSRP